MQTYTIVASVVVVVIGVLAGFAHAQNQECSIRNGNSPDPSNCETYLVCVNSQVTRIMSCPRGMRFDRLSGRCQRAELVNCGDRAVDSGVPECTDKPITVTIRAYNALKEPMFSTETVVKARPQPLRNFLLMAAGQDPMLRFEAQTIRADNGDFVTSVNTIANDVDGMWFVLDKYGVVIPSDIDNYIPVDGDIMTLAYSTEG